MIHKRWKTRQYDVYSKNHEDYCQRVTLIQTKCRNKKYEDVTILDVEESTPHASPKQTFKQSLYNEDNKFLMRAVQSIWHGALVRKQLQKNHPFIPRSESSELSLLIMIQAVVQMCLIKSKYFTLLRSSSVIQRLWKLRPIAIATSARNYKQYYNRISLLQRNSRHNEVKIEWFAPSSDKETFEKAFLARALQSIWRAVLVRKHVQRRRDAALTI